MQCDLLFAGYRHSVVGLLVQVPWTTSC